MNAGKPRVLLTGATGYVGGQLLKRLENAGYPVRCLARRPERVRAGAGASTEVVKGDVLDAASLGPALQGVKIAYYMVHSMGSEGSFEEKDRQAARNFGLAAAKAGVERIIYLGGLGDERERLSSHLKSRQEVGEVLRSAGVPVIEFRASIVIGPGSLSFEMIRALVERLPVMITPRWVSVPAQPIGISDLLDYLMQGAELALTESVIYEIGGPRQVSYGELMREYAKQRGLRRWMIPVPVLTPHLSSLWLGLVTPLYASVGKKLIESIRYPTVILNPKASEIFNVKPLGVKDCIAEALKIEDYEFSRMRWSEEFSAPANGPEWNGKRFGNRILDSKKITVRASMQEAFAPIRRIGGERGWYYGQWLWSIRGAIDLILGGVGLLRGRKDADAIAPGDIIDFWRVDLYEPDRRLRLAAEMKLPGRAWLDFELTNEGGDTAIRQTAIFDPVGAWGLIYWYALYPVHQLIFKGMLREIARRASPERA